MRDFMDSEPELEPFEDEYLRAFWRLVSERRGGHIIPYSEIVKYATRLGLDSAMIDTFVAVTWSLERAHAEWAKSQVPSSE
tara:strand:- start:31013 stop:31255 length:243 start_codon:yes stop_codon:yes gene_type:complete